MNTCGIKAFGDLHIYGSKYWSGDARVDDVSTFFLNFEISDLDIDRALVDMHNSILSMDVADAHQGYAHFNVSCTWITENKDRWKDWLPEVAETFNLA